MKRLLVLIFGCLIAQSLFSQTKIVNLVESRDSFCHLPVYEFQSYLAFECWNSNGLSFAFDGCDGLVRDLGFVSIDNPSSDINLSLYNNFFIIYNEFQLHLLHYRNEDSCLKQCVKLSNNSFDFDLLYFAENDCETRKIYNSTFDYGQKNLCRSDGIFYYKIFYSKFQAIQTGQILLQTPNFSRLSSDDPFFIELNPNVFIVTKILEIYPVSIIDFGP